MAVNWSSPLVNSTKKKIKDELDAIGRELGLSERLALCLRKSSESMNQPTGQKMLESYVYSVAALHHHKVHGGLTSSQVKKIFRYASTILATQIPDPSVSRVGFLYAELYMTMSQLMRALGRHWESALYLQMADATWGRNSSDQKGRQALAFGIRSLRLGFSAVAQTSFQTAAAFELSASGLLTTHINLLRIHRYRLDSESFFAQLESCRQLSSDPAFSEELEWEKACFLAATQGEVKALALMTRPKRTHYRAENILEACLWMRALGGHELEEFVPNLSYKVRIKDLGLRNQGALLSVCLELEQAQDDAVPLAVRSQKLGESTSLGRELLTIEQELLFKAAVTRWFHRKRRYGLAMLFLKQYESDCLRLSDYRIGDCFGVLRSIFESDRYSTKEPKSVLPKTG